MGVFFEIVVASVLSILMTPPAETAPEREQNEKLAFVKPKEHFCDEEVPGFDFGFTN